MKKLTLRDTQLIELNILLEFHALCNEYNLRYYLSGGTLLGAIRHKGFIPWDDDIDLAMPREDFNKLIELSRNYRHKDYKFIFYNDEGILQPYGKLINYNTFIDLTFSHGEMDKHLWIDIMPMDGLPESDDEVNYIYKKASFYRMIIKLCNAKLGKGKTFIKKIAKFILKPLALIYGKNRAINKLNELSIVYSYEKSKYVGAIGSGLYGISERMLKSELDNIVEVNFEGHTFYSFSCWDSYLKNLYGDYMQLPPVDKRINHEMVAWIESDE